jgi:hypothetical protein
MKLFFLLLITILFSACFRNSKNVTVHTDLSVKKIEDSLLAVKTEQQIMLKQQLKDSLRIADSIAALVFPINYDTVLFASILRSPCHGNCPHYEIRLYQSGLVEYFGYAAVEKIGKFQCRIDSAKLGAISEMATKCNFFEMSDFYPETGIPINDFPMCVCSIKKENDLKVVYNRNDAPISLIKFQNFLDLIFEVQQWEPINPTAGKALLPGRQ